MQASPGFFDQTRAFKPSLDHTPLFFNGSSVKNVYYSLFLYTLLCVTVLSPFCFETYLVRFSFPVINLKIWYEQVPDFTSLQHPVSMFNPLLMAQTPYIIGLVSVSFVLSVQLLSVYTNLCHFVAYLSEKSKYQILEWDKKKNDADIS